MFTEARREAMVIRAMLNAVFNNVNNYSFKQFIFNLDYSR